MLAAFCLTRWLLTFEKGCNLFKLQISFWCRHKMCPGCEMSLCVDLMLFKYLHWCLVSDHGITFTHTESTFKKQPNEKGYGSDCSEDAKKAFPFSTLSVCSAWLKLSSPQFHNNTTQYISHNRKQIKMHIVTKCLLNYFVRFWLTFNWLCHWLRVLK